MTHRDDNDSRSVGKTFTLQQLITAPRELVFRMWTDEKRLAEWWGPHDFTNAICEIDAHEGGGIRIDMCGPDGTITPNRGKVTEIRAPEWLVFELDLEDGDGNKLISTLNTIAFGEAEGKTQVSVRVEVTHCDREAIPFLEGMEVGWAQTLERLAEQVKQEQDGE